MIHHIEKVWRLQVCVPLFVAGTDRIEVPAEYDLHIIELIITRLHFDVIIGKRPCYIGNHHMFDLERNFRMGLIHRPFAVNHIFDFTVVGLHNRFCLFERRINISLPDRHCGVREALFGRKAPKWGTLSRRGEVVTTHNGTYTRGIQFVPVGMGVSSMKVISTKALTISDFVMGTLLITAPWLFGNVKGDIETWMAAGIGGYTIIYSLLTCYENILFIAEHKLRHVVITSPVINPDDKVIRRMQ